ncbi:MAG: carboxymuconolactone decarboxylase family protein [Nannocystaceae bacterium]|nr:carboxymuconolactone decarboxylase family protein [Nannocystaceae bacterium]
MAWIKVLNEAEVMATGGRLARLYKAALDPHTHRLDNVIQIHSLRPPTLEGHLKLYGAVMHASDGLSRREREMLAVAVSAANACHY